MCYKKLLAQLLRQSIIGCVQVDAERTYHQNAAEILDKLYTEVRISLFPAGKHQVISMPKVVN